MSFMVGVLIEILTFYIMTSYMIITHKYRVERYKNRALMLKKAGLD